MFVSDKIISFGDIYDGIGKFVILKVSDYPTHPEMRRTTFDRNIDRIRTYATRGEFSYTVAPDTADPRDIVGVELNRLRKVRPEWCITDTLLMEQFEALQQENHVNYDRIRKDYGLNLRTDREMLAAAKRLWEIQLSARYLKSKKT